MTVQTKTPGRPWFDVDTIVPVMVAIMTIIALSGVPWAFKMHGRLSMIEAKIDQMEVPPSWFLSDVQSLERRVDTLERDFYRNESP